MTFPIKKRINTELFIDRTAALYIVNGRIRNIERVFKHWYWPRLIRRLSIPYAKDVGMRNQTAAFFGMTFMGM